VSAKQKFKNIKKISIVGMVLSVLAFGSFWYIGQEADKGIMILDQGELGKMRIK